MLSSWDGKRWGALWFAIAAIVGTSRAYVRIHHASDVVAGAIVGAVLGIAARRVLRRYDLPDRPARSDPAADRAARERSPTLHRLMAPIVYDRTMSDAEGLMWRLEKDPYLSSTFANVTILDRKPNFDKLRRRMERIGDPHPAAAPTGADRRPAT